MNFIRGNCIGQGSFGTVNIAVDKSGCHLFAVKSVRTTSFYSAQLEALENEIRVLKSLSSPFIVDYLGDDITNETVTYRNLHMEYMPGGTAADVAKHSGGVDVDERIIKSVTSCIVSALTHIHSLGIAHCDVKGRNVLLGPTPGVAKLADFGSAATWTEGIRPRGSPLWMAPEVVRGEYQGPESDVWSLGCTVIEMVTGKPAWEDKGYETLCRIGYAEELPQLPVQLSELGRDFLAKCLRKDYRERWSCEQLLQHPFLVSCGAVFDTVSHWSPRCVLDQVFDSSFVDYDFVNFDGKGMIGKLASTSRVIWEESDGWVAVRAMASDVSVSGACSTGCGEEGRGGINLEYPEMINEITGEYSGGNMIAELSVRVNWEYSDSCGSNILPNDVNYVGAGVKESEPHDGCRCRVLWRTELKAAAMLRISPKNLNITIHST